MQPPMHHRRRTLAVLGAAWLCTPGAVFGQACEAFLDHGLRNVASVVTTDVYSRIDYAQDCGSDYALKSNQEIAAIAVKIGIHSGGASFNRSQIEQRLKTWCTTNASNLHTNAYNASQSSVLADYAVKAWSECVALERQDVRIRPAITPDAQTVTVTMQYVGTGRVGPQFLGTAADGYQLQSVIGPASVRTKALNNVPFTLPRSAVVVLRYQRMPARDTIVGGATYSYYPRGSIDMSAATQSVQLYFPAEWTPNLPQQAAAALDQQLSALARQVSTLQTAMGAQATQLLSALKDSTAAVRALAASAVQMSGGTHPSMLAKSCPSGWTNLGTVGLITPTGSSGTMASRFAGGGQFNSGWTWFHPQLCTL